MHKNAWPRGEEGLKSCALPAINVCCGAGIVYLEEKLFSYSVHMSCQRLWFVEMSSRAQEK